MLSELARVLRPGGSALVTVWASEQQPGKLAKWEPIGQGGQAALDRPRVIALYIRLVILDRENATSTDERSGKADVNQLCDVILSPGGFGSGQWETPATADFAGSESGGGDYFVPWHVPFHRVEAAAAAAKAHSGEAPQQQHKHHTASPHQLAAHDALAGSGAAVCMQQPQQTEDRQDASAASPSGDAAGEPELAQDAAPCPDSGAGDGRPHMKDVFPDGRVDRAKGTVVFKRYYHLYDKGELDDLVHQVPGVQLRSSFFDKSNWCAIYQKV